MLKVNKLRLKLFGFFGVLSFEAWLSTLLAFWISFGIDFLNWLDERKR